MEGRGVNTTGVRRVSWRAGGAALTAAATTHDGRATLQYVRRTCVSQRDPPTCETDWNADAVGLPVWVQRKLGVEEAT
jgi:hypothetical protein